MSQANRSDEDEYTAVFQAFLTTEKTRVFYPAPGPELLVNDILRRVAMGTRITISRLNNHVNNESRCQSRYNLRREFGKTWRADRAQKPLIG